MAFGRFLLRPLQLELLADGHPVKLGRRACDVLIALIEARGAVLSKEALMERVWPGRIVEENALQSQISALRSAFGRDRELIRTVSGRGYQFIGELRAQSPRETKPVVSRFATSTAAKRSPPSNLPLPVSELIGRGNELGEIERLVIDHRMVTLTGAGGIGKTCLALAAAHRLVRRFPDGIYVVELSALSDPRLVPAAIAVAAGLESGGTVTARQVARALADRCLLLVLDTCEHVVAAAAAMAQELLQAGAAAHVLATSREPLRAEGEWVCRVLPLAVPEAEASDTDFLAYGSVRLFIERARAVNSRFTPNAEQLATIGAICRRLDGLPLAIELAAARTVALSVNQLLALLDDCFRLLIGGRRTALARQQTLRATLEWSHDLLPEPESVLLRRLGVFSGAFSLGGAIAVATSAELPAARVMQGLMDLIAKSLVVADMRAAARYRLLDTTRAFAIEKLAAAGESNLLAQRHAEYYRAVFTRAESEVEALPATDWLAEYRPKLDNLRGALSWAFAAAGDTAIGIGLATASVPLWFELSLFGECRGWMERALEALGTDDHVREREMILRNALGYSLLFSQGANDRAQTELTRSAELAAAMGDLDYRLRSLAGLASISNRAHDFRAAVAFGREAQAAVTAASDPVVTTLADWILGVSLHRLAEYSDCLTYAERTFRQTQHPAVRRAHIARVGRDTFISAGGTLAMVRWALGLVDQAAETVNAMLAEAEVCSHSSSACLALTWCGGIVAFRRGDIAIARDATARLKERSRGHELGHYRGNVLCFEGQIALRLGDAAAAEELLRAGINRVRNSPSEALHSMFLSAHAEALLALDRYDAALAAATYAVRRCEEHSALWWLPEALRVEGEVLTRSGGAGIAHAEAEFQRSLEMARRQKALSWELRTAVTMARSWHARGRSADAAALLRPVYNRFTEGFDTADLHTARALLDTLHVTDEAAARKARRVR
ncbi:MAG: winged helix-turn-helix domain-containing protein [Alphaproteobacteria bacterium]|nr:winged helix-turn-helix domain-containing protein [Alphaproteobacteria bacterium]